MSASVTLTKKFGNKSKTICKRIVASNCKVPFKSKLEVKSQNPMFKEFSKSKLEVYFKIVT